MVESQAQPSIKMVLPETPRVKALIDGTVKVPGVHLDIDASIKNPGKRFERFMAGEFDAGEMCVLSYIRAREEGWPFVGLPVFFVRGLKHRHIVVRKDSGIGSPSDLAGKVVGVMRYATSPVLTRALIQHEYGVPIDSVRWITSDPEVYPIRNPEFRYETLPPGTNLLDILVEGKIDAAILPGNDEYYCFYGGGPLDQQVKRYPNLKTLIDDPQTVIEYYRRTGIYPIIHMFVIKERLLQENPGLAREMTLALHKAKSMADKYEDEEDRKRVKEERRIIGRDPYECKLTEQDVKTLDALLDYLIEQKLLRTKPSVRSLFASESLEIGL